jgi:hypothetical protein
MDHVRFARRLFIVLFSVTLTIFWLEFAWDFSRAIDPATGAGVRLGDLRATPAMVRSLASTIGGAYGTMIALLLTFVSLAIPITANLYTPKLIEIFIRDPINLFVICTCAVLAAHNLLTVSISFDQWTAQVPFAIAVAGAIFGWLLILPYYFYVVSFINPETIVKRVHRMLTRELEQAIAARYPIAVSQRRVLDRIHSLGSVLLRVADRGDREMTLYAARTHVLEIVSMRHRKDLISPDFLRVDNELLAGVAGDATEILTEAGVWVENQIATQLVQAFRIALDKMPDDVSALARLVKNAAHEEARRHNDEVFYLLVRVLNLFLREAIKTKRSTAAFNVIYVYKALVRRLLTDRPEYVPQLVTYMQFYAGFARSLGLPFIFERLSYELAQLTEVAYGRAAPPCRHLLDAVLAFDGVGQSVGLVKSRLILGSYFLERGLAEELAVVVTSLRAVAPALLNQAGRAIAGVEDRVFWELNDQVVNFDFVEPQRRRRVTEILNGLRPASETPASQFEWTPHEATDSRG